MDPDTPNTFCRDDPVDQSLTLRCLLRSTPVCFSVYVNMYYRGEDEEKALSKQYL